MASVHGERVDHLGLVACMIHAVGLIRMIDARRMPDAPEAITAGEAVAGMIRKGLGCAHRPLSLTPQCVTNTPLARRCRPGVRAAMCKRGTRGRTLDAVHAAGGALWWSAVALAVCAQEGLEPRCQHLDTTRGSRSGDEVPERAERAMHLTHGAAKDHRPDGQQAV